MDIYGHCAAVGQNYELRRLKKTITFHNIP